MAAFTMDPSLPCASPVWRGSCVVVTHWSRLVLMLVACSHSALAALAHALVLYYNWSGGHWALCLCAISWPDTSADVCGLQLFTLHMVYLHHARPWIILGNQWGWLYCTPRSHQSPVRPHQTASCLWPFISCTSPPSSQLPRAICAGLFFLVLRTNHSSYLSFGESPTAP